MRDLKKGLTKAKNLMAAKKREFNTKYEYTNSHTASYWTLFTVYRVTITLTVSTVFHTNCQT